MEQGPWGAGGEGLAATLPGKLEQALFYFWTPDSFMKNRGGASWWPCSLLVPVPQILNSVKYRAVVVCDPVPCPS